MTSIRCNISISADGYAAGPNPSLEVPLGEGGERLHDWAVATSAWREAHGREGGERNPDDDVILDVNHRIGAYVMGRNMFGGGPGGWADGWRGWWGDEPPFRAPVFVVTHHERDPLTLGQTTFHFVTDGVEAAVSAARSAAGDRDVMVAGGAATVNQCLAAGLLDELFVHVVPITLGAGERLYEGVGRIEMTPAEVVASPGATHIRYRFG